MTALERRYRSLLRIYPAAHRAAYAEEMIGVLMAGSAPGRRFPSPADALDLVRAGLTARLGHAFPPLSGTTWRAAAGVTALITALFMAAGNLASLTEDIRAWSIGDPALSHRTVDAALLASAAFRVSASIATGAAALLGRRQVAAVLAAVAVVAEFSGVVYWLGRSAPGMALRESWAPIMATVICVAFVKAAPARSSRDELGRPGRWLIVAASVSMIIYCAVFQASGPRLAAEVSGDGIPLALLAGVVAAVEPPVRRKVVVLLLATAAVFVFLMVWIPAALTGGTGSIPDVPSLRVVVLVLAPALLAAVGTGVLLGGERFGSGKRGQVKGHE